MKFNKNRVRTCVSQSLNYYGPEPVAPKGAPRIGDVVEFQADCYGMPAYEQGTVTDVLNTQFTAEVERRRPDGGSEIVTRFGFYRDKGSVWK